MSVVYKQSKEKILIFNLQIVFLLLRVWYIASCATIYHDFNVRSKVHILCETIRRKVSIDLRTHPVNYIVWLRLHK